MQKTEDVVVLGFHGKAGHMVSISLPPDEVDAETGDEFRLVKVKARTKKASSTAPAPD